MCVWHKYFGAWFSKFFKKKKIQIKYLATISKSKAKKNKILDYNFDNLFLYTNKINLYKCTNFNLDSRKDLNFFKKEKFDLGICIGWQRILPENILSQFKMGIYGWHGSYLKLPDGAGRSPINWSIRMGQKKIFHTLFRYNRNCDAGEIFEIVKINIRNNDYFSDVKVKVNEHIKKSSFRLINAIIKNKLVLTKQLKKKNKIFFPKISSNDLKIYSKEMTTKVAYDLIRSASYPFSGSNLFKNKKKIMTIYRSTIKNFSNKFVNLTPGSLFFYKKKFYLKFNNGFLRLNDYKIFNNKLLNNTKIICD